MISQYDQRLAIKKYLYFILNFHLLLNDIRSSKGQVFHKFEQVFIVISQVDFAFESYTIFLFSLQFQLILNLQFKMDKFQDLLTQAAQLKQSQLKKERKNFQALPEYLKSGLNFSKKYQQLRKQHFYVQLHMSQKLKTIGNKLFALKNYPQALSKYQEALSIFRYIHAKKYQNLKDQDIIYENYQPQPQFDEQHRDLLVALYLNICSSLTKMNKKQEAVHSSEQALKLKQSAKGNYKKAQAYLQYINKDKDDIKLGFYYLNKSYELSKDQSIIVEMHRIKKEIEQQTQKQKKWFKFMFDKNKNDHQDYQTSNPQLKQKCQQIKKQIQRQSKKKEQVNVPQNKIKKTSNLQLDQFMQDVKNINQEQAQNQSQSSEVKQKSEKDKRMETLFTKFKDEIVQEKSQTLRLEQHKQKLKKYLILEEEQWKVAYQEDFIQKNGSKMYSIIQIYNYKQYLLQYKSLLAKCLQIKGKSQSTEHKCEVYQKFFNWLFAHPIQKYQKYIERYNIQIEWIQKNRNTSNERQTYTQKIQEKLSNFDLQLKKQQIYEEQIKMRQNQKTKGNIKQLYNESLKSKKQQASSSNNISHSILSTKLQDDQSTNPIKSKKRADFQQQRTSTKHQYTQRMKQEEQINEQTPDEVPQQVKKFLEDYGDLDKKSQNSQGKKAKTFLNEQKQKDVLSESVKKDSMNFLYTFLFIIVISTALKLLF